MLCVTTKKNNDNGEKPHETPVHNISALKTAAAADTAQRPKCRAKQSKISPIFLYMRTTYATYGPEGERKGEEVLTCFHRRHAGKDVAQSAMVPPPPSYQKCCPTFIPCSLDKISSPISFVVATSESVGVSALPVIVPVLPSPSRTGVQRKKTTGSACQGKGKRTARKKNTPHTRAQQKHFFFLFYCAYLPLHAPFWGSASFLSSFLLSVIDSLSFPPQPSCVPAAVLAL